MNWLRVDLCLDQQQSASVEAALQELEAISIEYADSGDTPILEPEPGTAPLWKSLRISGLFSADVSQTAIANAIAKALAPDEAPQLTFERVPERDWVAEFKQSLTPMRFGTRLWVCPTGHDCPDPTAPRVVLDPGLAFGTGGHPTTALCLDWLAGQALQSRTLLDYGCGSGVLSIAALALGARAATATDIDTQALAATRANAERNAVQGRISIVTSDQLDPDARFDLIVANILSNTLADLAPALVSHARPGTRIALSGILADQIMQVSRAYEQWVRFSEPELRTHWALLEGTVT